MNIILLVNSIMEMGLLWESKTYFRNVANLVSNEELWIWANLCKEVSCQSLRSEKNLLLGKLCTSHWQPWFETQTMGSSSKFDWSQLCSTLIWKVCQFLCGKIQDSIKSIVPAHKTSNILKIGLPLKKTPFP